MKKMNLKTCMSDSEKNTLLVSLCSYLPYRLKCLYCDTDNEVKTGDLKAVHCSDNRILIGNVSIDYSDCDTLGVTPYLFPLSSMTEGQGSELFSLFGINVLDSVGKDYIKINETTGITFFFDRGFDVETHFNKLIDWLNKNHFDYRELIKKELAIDCTNLNIY